MTADVTILIPAYKAEPFVANAIESVLGQSYRDIRVIISVDPAGDGTEAACRRYASDPRVMLNINAERLGWVGNMNWCLDQVDTPFFGACFHDDVYAPEFVEKTRAALIANPGAEAAFCHMAQVGSREGVLEHADMRGSAFDRVRDRLTQTSSAYGFKSLGRSTKILNGLRMPQIDSKGYRADWPIIVAQALSGMFMSVPEVLYTKAFAPRTATSGWHKIPPNDLLRYEAEIQADMIAQVAMSDVPDAEKLALIELIHARKPFFELGDQVLNAAFLNSLEARKTTFMAARLAGMRAAEDASPTRDSKIDTFKARQTADLAQRCLAVPDLFGAMYHARVAASLDPELAAPQIIAARASFLLFKDGNAAMRDISKTHALRVTELSPDMAFGWSLLARLELSQGNPVQALAHAERAVSCSGPNQSGDEALRDQIRKKV